MSVPKTSASLLATASKGNYLRASAVKKTITQT